MVFQWVFSLLKASTHCFWHNHRLHLKHKTWRHILKTKETKGFHTGSWKHQSDDTYPSNRDAGKRLSAVNMGLFTLLEIGFHVPVYRETISIVKGCRVTAALLFAKENQKTLKCPWRRYSLGQETGLQVALRLKGAVSWKGQAGGLCKGKGWFFRRLSCLVTGQRWQSPSQSAFQSCISWCWLYGCQLH